MSLSGGSLKIGLWMALHNDSLRLTGSDIVQGYD